MPLPWDLYGVPVVNPGLKVLIESLKGVKDRVGKDDLGYPKVSPNQSMFGYSGPDGQSVSNTDMATSPYTRAVTGQEAGPPSTAQPGWWNSLPAELNAMAPQVPMSNPDGSRSWGGIPFVDPSVPVSSPPQVPNVPGTGGMAGATEPSIPPQGQPDINSALTQQTQPGMFGGMFGGGMKGMSPDMSMALLRAGMQLMQPIQPGQTVGGRLGEVGLGGLDYLEAKRRLDLQEKLLKSRDTRDERKTTAEEQQVKIAGDKEKREAQKEQALTPAQTKKLEADAAEARAKGDYYTRSSGRNTGTQAKTREDLKAKMLGKLDFELLDPQDLPKILSSIDAAVASSGLPGAAEAAATSSAAAGKAWPKSAKEAVSAIKSANPKGLSPSQKLQVETELKKRYPDYQVGTFDK